MVTAIGAAGVEQNEGGIEEIARGTCGPAAEARRTRLAGSGQRQRERRRRRPRGE